MSASEKRPNSRTPQIPQDGVPRMRSNWCMRVTTCVRCPNGIWRPSIQRGNANNICVTPRTCNLWFRRRGSWGGLNLRPNQRGLSNTRPASDDEHFVLASLSNCLLLAYRQLDAQTLFDPSDCLFDIHARQRMWGRRTVAVEVDVQRRGLAPVVAASPARECRSPRCESAGCRYSQTRRRRDRLSIHSAAAVSVFRG